MGVCGFATPAGGNDRYGGVLGYVDWGMPEDLQKVGEKHDLTVAFLCCGSLVGKADNFKVLRERCQRQARLHLLCGVSHIVIGLGPPTCLLSRQTLFNRLSWHRCSTCSSYVTTTSGRMSVTGRLWRRWQELPRSWPGTQTSSCCTGRTRFRRG